MSAILAAGGSTGRPAGTGRLALRGIALTYLFLLLIVPVGVVLHDGLADGLGGMIDTLAAPPARHALVLTIWTAAVMAAINAVMGTLTAFVLVRCEFPFRRLLNSAVDLPLAIPTLVTGVMLVALFGPQRALGAFLQNEWGLRIIFAPSGIVLALLFVTLPFVVRSVQPVLEGLDLAQEDAARILGAGPITTFRRVILPAILPALMSGTLLSFARAMGEFGSIVIVAGNLPMRTQTAAVFVLGEVESDNRTGASAMSIVMMAITFSLVLLVDWIDRRRRGSS